MSRNKILFVSFFFSLTSTVNAENTPAEKYPWDSVSKEIYEKCKSVENISIPPHPQTLEVLEGCDAEELYYGFTQTRDYVKARSCAEARKDNMDYGILAMLYANGKGVTRNLDIAIHYACKFEGSAAELEGRIKHLIELKNTERTAKDFDICDDITSGNMMGHCAAIESRFKDAKRQEKYASLISNWTPEERKGFERLQNAFDVYREARMGEIDISGTARGMFMIEEKNSLEDRFFKTLRACTQNKVPRFTSSQYQKADHELNSFYKKALAIPYFEHSGINSEGIKKTQRAWLKYRDSWVTFGDLKCPNITVDNWKTLMTKERIKELRELTTMGRNM
jgi:uncharacterized protein YecT (DUF1311 family)